MSRIKKIIFKIALFALFIILLPSNAKLDVRNSKDVISPGARWGHVFIYNPVGKRILLFGGTNQRSGPYFNDTWVWENGSWKKLDTPGPPPRGFCAAAFHKERQSIIIHGGRGNDRVTYSDLWEWDGKMWTQIDSNSLYQADHHQMVYLESENALLAFGGWNGKEVLGSTWRWSKKWEQLNTPSPPKRAAFGMAYNYKINKVYLFGGLWINGQYADLWEWSDWQWSPLGGPYDNSSLDHHAMIYDHKLEKIIGFGGKNYRYESQGTTFQIENNKIEAIAKEGPAGRHSFGFAYDDNSNLGYVYGGKSYKKGEQIALDDFWRWDGYRWEQINPRNE